LALAFGVAVRGDVGGRRRAPGALRSRLQPLLGAMATMQRDGATVPPPGARWLDGCCEGCCYDRQPRVLPSVPAEAAADPEWVTAAMLRRGSLGAGTRVRSVQVKELGGGEPNGGGKSGTRLVKLELAYADAPSASSDGGRYVVAEDYRRPQPAVRAQQGRPMHQQPPSVIHKFATVDTIPKRICTDGGCLSRFFLAGALGVRPDKMIMTEAAFYRDLAPRLQTEARVPMPQLFHVGTNGSVYDGPCEACCWVCCCKLPWWDCCACCGLVSAGAAVDASSSILLEDLSLRGAENENGPFFGSTITNCSSCLPRACLDK